MQDLFLQVLSHSLLRLWMAPRSKLLPTWSQIQYHEDTKVHCNSIAVQGKSPVAGSRSTLIASDRGKPHVVVLSRIDGVAFMYAGIRF